MQIRVVFVTCHPLIVGESLHGLVMSRVEHQVRYKLHYASRCSKLTRGNQDVDNKIE